MSELHETQVKILEMQIKQMELEGEMTKLEIAKYQRISDEVAASKQPAPQPKRRRSIGELVNEFKSRFGGG